MNARTLVKTTLASVCNRCGGRGVVVVREATLTRLRNVARDTPVSPLPFREHEVCCDCAVGRRYARAYPNSSAARRSAW